MTIKDLEQTHQDGTYAALYMSKPSQDRLVAWLDEQGIEHDDPAEFHCTVLYSRTPMPQAEAVAGPVSVTATAKDWELLGDHATVLLVQCAKAEQIHQLFLDQGASHDWPSYIAHVTVNSEQHLENLPEQKPNFTLTFDRLEVRPIQH